MSGESSHAPALASQQRGCRRRSGRCRLGNPLTDGIFGEPRRIWGASNGNGKDGIFSRMPGVKQRVQWVWWSGSRPDVGRRVWSRADAAVVRSSSVRLEFSAVPDHDDEFNAAKGSDRRPPMPDGPRGERVGAHPSPKHAPDASSSGSSGDPREIDDPLVRNLNTVFPHLRMTEDSASDRRRRADEAEHSRSTRQGRSGLIRRLFSWFW